MDYYETLLWNTILIHILHEFPPWCYYLYVTSGQYPSITHLIKYLLGGISVSAAGAIMMQGNSSLGKSIPLLAAILSVVITGLIISVLLFTDIRSSQKQLAGKMFGIVNRIVDDSRKVLVPLNRLGFEDCTGDTLLAMRSALFESLYARSIVYYKNGIGICTSGTGMLDPPIRRPPPDFVSPDNYEVWINRNINLRLTGEHYNAVVIKLDHYSLMLDMDYFNLTNSAPFAWQLVYHDPQNMGHFVHISGDERLYKQQLLKPARKGRLSAYYYEECNNRRPYYCMALSTTNMALLRYYPLVIGLMTVLSLAFGYITYNYVETWMHDRIRIKSRVPRGLYTNAYFWLYQPIVELQTREIVGCEVLSRFRDKYGDSSPEVFLPAVRETGNTWRLTKKMVEKVLPELEGCEHLPDGFKVSLNIFPHDVTTGDINELVTLPEIINTRFALAIEITEDEYLDESRAQSNLNKLHKSGLIISLDDFGTGYSNLKQIKKLHCSYLKIDRSYVVEIEDTSVKSSLIPHIVNIAEQLNLEVIAEGIENEQQRELLANLGVKFGQGWAFGKPMTAAELAALIVKG